ncbi:MAG: adenylate/guanylate cyclase domain-containing protein, partial [Mycobacterium sp.]
MTVLFADVVHSMDIAAMVGPERLREIMTELVKRSTAVVQRYGGTVDKFTGDGVMALFGAPIALEDHAFRACLAALDIQQESRGFASELMHSDGIELQLRIGLNSGQVIAGDIGAGPMSYTAVGEHVGMAQRMESIAPAGGVMLSESSSRLVEHAVVLDEPEMVRIKGSDDQVCARRLISTTVEREQVEREAPTFVGRTWELNTIAELLDEAAGAVGCIVNIVGPPGIGKSRVAKEAAALAADRDMDVITTYCESHAGDVPFHAVARLLRSGFGIIDLDSDSARARIRAQTADADPEDVAILEDLLGIADPATPAPAVEADARKRRLTALINMATLGRTRTALYVIEDVHWIDEISESMLAAFLTVVPQSRAMVLLTYRPEYQGLLARVASAQAIALRPLSDAHTSTLIRELLGSHPSVAGLAEHIAERARGNPFFAEEMVRDLTERNIIQGHRGEYVLHGDAAQVSIPATLQAAIAARIDRLTPAAKHTLSAAAVVGSRFGSDILRALGIEPAFDELVTAELIDQVKFTHGEQFVFRHPLVRAVAYESQLKSARTQLHRRLAGFIEEQQSADENAALIAEHFEIAGDLRQAFGWHMRAGTWLTNRDIASARASWERARHIADRLPADDPDRLAMRIAPRTLLTLSVWRAGGTMEDVAFDELRELTSAAGDKVSLAMAMAGQVSALIVHARPAEASSLGSEYVHLIESIGDPTLTLALLYAAVAAKSMTNEMREVIRLSRRIIDLAGNDATKGNLIIGSPLATAFTLRGVARCSFGEPGWRDDIERGMEIAKSTDPFTWATLSVFKYGCLVIEALPADAAALRETADMLALAERSADDFTLAGARYSRGLTLVRQPGPEREQGLMLLAMAREAAVDERFTMATIPVIDMQTAAEKLRIGDVDGAVELSRTAVEQIFNWQGGFGGVAVDVLVESLLQRGTENDLQEAQAVIDRLAAMPAEPGTV